MIEKIKEAIGLKPYYENENGALYCGDCLDILPRIPNGSIDLVITSPPYNKKSASRKPSKRDSWARANIDYGVFKDDLPEQEYQEQQKKIIQECLNKIKNKGSFFYNHKNRIINHKVLSPETWLNSFIIRQIIIWDRNGSPVLEPIRFLPVTEQIYWITKERATPYFNKDCFSYKDVWRISPTQDKEHPASFPLEIPQRCINACSKIRDIVLDPFLGSGTTAVACESLGRKWIGIELSEKYCEIAKQRIHDCSLNLF